MADEFSSALDARGTLAAAQRIAREYSNSAASLSSASSTNASNVSDKSNAYDRLAEDDPQRRKSFAAAMGSYLGPSAAPNTSVSADVLRLLNESQTPGVCCPVFESAEPVFGPSASAAASSSALASGSARNRCRAHVWVRKTWLVTSTALYRFETIASGATDFSRLLSDGRCHELASVDAVFSFAAADTGTFGQNACNTGQ
jgi:hypothetical protein